MSIGEISRKRVTCRMCNQPTHREGLCQEHLTEYRRNYKRSSRAAMKTNGGARALKQANVTNRMLRDQLEMSKQEQQRMERHIEAIESELHIYRSIAAKHPELFGRKVERKP